MAKESIILERNAGSDGHPNADTALNRDDAIVTGPRDDTFNIAGPHGRLPASLGGLFSPVIGQPAFVYDAITGILTATDHGVGVIAPASLGLYPRGQDCAVAIRDARSSGDGKLHRVDTLTRASWAAETARVDVQWSNVQFVRHDDGIALDASPAVVGSLMTCDLESTPVYPGNRRCGRDAGGL